MRLLTFGDDPSRIKYLKSNFENIGLKKPFVDLFSKFDAMKEWFLEKNPSDDEIIVFVDGYDVVQKRTDIDEFEKEFLKFEADIVWSAEANCWPNKWMQNMFANSPTKYRWPNSGTFVGRAWAIKKMLYFGPYRINVDDQGYVHDFFLRGAGMAKMTMDYHQILFQTGTAIDWSELDATKAWFVHFNGKSHLDANHGSVLEVYASGQAIGGIPRLISR
jgi:hypothetical protein